jgi:hypothetical protein
MQSNINKLIKYGCANIDEDVSPYYEQLLNSIKCNDVCFNVKSKLNEYIAQSSIDVVVHKCMNDDEREVIIIQRIKIRGSSIILIGVLAFNTKSNKQSFAVEINNHQGNFDVVMR